MKRKLFQFLQYFFCLFPMKVRIAFYKLFGMKIGKGTSILPRCYFETPWLVQIGENSFINQNVKVYNGPNSSVLIGNHVSISYDVRFVGINHEIGPEEHRAGKHIYKSIKVEDGCWIGAGVSILPGVTLGKGCVIGVGAVVTKNCEPNTVYVGVPARPIRKL